MYFTYLLKQLIYRVIDSFKTFNEKGIRVGFAELGRTSTRIFYQRAEYVVLANILSENATPAKLQTGLIIRQVVAREEIASLISPIADSPDTARFYQLFDHGSIAFIACQNDQAVGHCWISKDVDPSVNRVGAALRLGSRDAYVHDLFTSPAHRGKGIGRSLVNHHLGYLREHGHERAVTAVIKNNMPALKVHKGTGYKVVGELLHTRILFWNYFRYNGFEL